MNLTEWKQIMNLSGTAINIDDIPSEIDVVPVIRCKDCRFGHRSELVEEKIICKYGGYGKSSQDWCSWAERKEE